MNGFEKLESLIKKLDSSRTPYDLKRVREGYVMLAVATPGKRWEIEVSTEGCLEVEVFVSNGKILDETALGQLWMDLQ